MSTSPDSGHSGTRTPLAQDSSVKPIESSPIGIVSKYFLPEYRYERRFMLEAFDESGFLQLLKVKLPESVPGVHSGAQGSFLDLANKVAEFIKEKHFPERDILVFQNTENKLPPGHVTDTKCRPDITAALRSHWGNGVVSWPFIRLAGQKASNEKTPGIQMGQAISYLHYMLLARPDLYVVQGLLSSEKEVIFLFGIGGEGIRRFHVKWENKKLNKLLYAFIYRLYEPGDFADPSYIRTEFDDKTTARYTITIKHSTEQCHGFYPIYASNPFATRTHVLSNPDFNGSLTILKDHFCEVERRFVELTILQKYVHKPEQVPGVVVATYGETITPPLSKKRRKYRLGLKESGSPFASIPTLSQVLETLFDVLEVLRYLRLYRKVLHRDISSGNVLYIDNSSNRSPPPKTVPVPPAQEAKTNALPLCFAKHLLDESDDPWETSMLLVDFNLAEYLEPEMSDKKPIYRTGTPIFVARAVEQGGPMPPDRAFVPGIPESPDPYAKAHPDRVEQFPSSTETPFDPNLIRDNGSNGVFRHELNHDAESVFWLLVYWTMVVQPEKCPEENIDSARWGLLNKNHESRDLLVLSFTKRFTDIGIHSYYKPLQPLMKDLAAILVVDGHWLKAPDRRKDPFYITEAFQRLILKFIIDNRGKDFMGRRVEKTFRKDAGLSRIVI